MMKRNPNRTHSAFIEMEKMNDKTTRHERHLREVGAESIAISDLPRKLAQTAAICRETRDYDTAGDACTISRIGFSLYFNSYAAPGAHPAPAKLRTGIHRGIQATFRAVSATIRHLERQKHDVGQLHNLIDFRENVKFRLDCWRKLHGENGLVRSDGRMRVIREIDKREVDTLPKEKIA